MIPTVWPLRERSQIICFPKLPQFGSLTSGDPPQCQRILLITGLVSAGIPIVIVGCLIPYGIFLLLTRGFNREPSAKLSSVPEYAGDVERA